MKQTTLDLSIICIPIANEIQLTEALRLLKKHRESYYAPLFKLSAKDFNTLKYSQSDKRWYIGAVTQTTIPFEEFENLLKEFKKQKRFSTFKKIFKVLNDSLSTSKR